ncbi:hypothetical protein GQ457_06G009270 [Hibiscus cannabinus]
MGCLSEQPHFVLFPFMAQGHLLPMVDIGRLLAQRGVIVTIVTTPHNAGRVQKSIARSIESGHPIRLVQLRFPGKEFGFPEGVENVDMVHSMEDFRKFFIAANKMEEAVEKLFEKLTPRPNCIVSDFCLYYTHKIATRFKVPRINFNGFCCFCILCLYNIHSSNILETITSDSEYFTVPGLTQKVEFTKAQLPGQGDESWKEIIEGIIEADQASYGIVINTFEELESDFVKEYKKVKKAWCVVGAEVDDGKIELLLSQVKGKDLTELIAVGREKFATIPSAGAAVTVTATAVGGDPAAASPAAAEANKEEKIEEEDDEDIAWSNDNVLMFLFLWRLQSTEVLSLISASSFRRINQYAYFGLPFTLISMGSLSERPHFVLFPFMAQGHLLPMVDIGRLLAQRGVIVTIVTTPHNAGRVQKSIGQSIKSGHPIRLVQLRFPGKEVGFPEGVENLDMVHSMEDFRRFIIAANKMEEAVEKLFEKLTPRPNCIVSDICLYYTHKIATRFKVPRMHFNGFCCFCILCLYNIHSSNILETITSDSEYFTVPGLTQKVEFTKAQLPGQGDESWKEIIEGIIEADQASYGIVINTFEELESDFVKEYKKVKKAWCVGPVSLSHKDESDKAERGNKASINEQQCLKCLDETL